MKFTYGDRVQVDNPKNPFYDGKEGVVVWYDDCGYLDKDTQEVAPAYGVELAHGHTAVFCEHHLGRWR